ncbi:hypothetical protein Vwe01_63220 [Micromonospora andamanensis]|nr:hypothetical protein Vwe01_63220 [Micromonospora andamanensis]
MYDFDLYARTEPEALCRYGLGRNGQRALPHPLRTIPQVARVTLGFARSFLKFDVESEW